jgi:hypothetical protein
MELQPFKSSGALLNRCTQWTLQRPLIRTVCFAHVAVAYDATAYGANIRASHVQLNLTQTVLTAAEQLLSKHRLICCLYMFTYVYVYVFEYRRCGTTAFTVDAYRR